MVAANVTTRTVAVDTVFEDSRTGTVSLLPQRVALIAQGQHSTTYETTPFRATGSAVVGETLGFRSPAYLMAQELFNRIGADSVGSCEVTVYPLEEANGSAAATGRITPSGTLTAAGEFRVRVNGIYSDPFTVDSGAVDAAEVITDIIAAVNAVYNMPMIASDGTTHCLLTSSWYGAAANDLYIEVVGDTSLGAVFTIVQPTGGLVNPDVTDATDLFGTRHETIVVNQMEYDDETTLDALQVAGEARWDELVNMPFIAFTGNTVSSRATATAVCSARRTDRVNAYCVAPGSVTLPCVVAAAQAAKVARVANATPAVGYGGIDVASIEAGADSVQWSHGDRNAAKLAGCSTIVVVDGVVQLNDVVTFYRPSGEDPPAYREVVSVMKIFNAINAFRSAFSTREWAAAPLLPDSAVTSLPEARKPKSAKAVVQKVLKGLAAEAIITDADAAFRATTATIDGQNPDRLDITVPFQVSGNTHVKPITLRWSFNYRSA